MDIHLSYDLPVSIGGAGITAFAHVFNALDAVYIQDAVDNSQYNGYYREDDNGNVLNNHSAATAEVFLGTPMYFNAGLSFNF